MKLKELIEILDSLPEEVKDMPCGSFDFGHFDKAELKEYLDREGWLGWHNGKAFSIIF